MDRNNTYFKQLVTHGELNEICDNIENADRNRDIDHNQWGVLSGLVVTETGPASTSVEISAGVAYDELGRRISVGSVQTEDLVSYIPAVGGQERYVAIYAQYSEVDSDTRVDGNGISLDYDSAESFDIVVVQGTAGAPSQVPPGIVANQVLLSNVLLTNGMGTVTNSEIESDWFASPVERHVGGTAWTDGRTQDTIIRIGSPTGGTFLLGNGQKLDLEDGECDCGDLVATNDATVQNDITATAGNIVASGGNITCSTGTIGATAGGVSVGGGTGNGVQIGGTGQYVYTLARSFSRVVNIESGQVTNGTWTYTDSSNNTRWVKGGATAKIFFPFTLPNGAVLTNFEVYMQNLGAGTTTIKCFEQIFDWGTPQANTQSQIGATITDATVGSPTFMIHTLASPVTKTIDSENNRYHISVENNGVVADQITAIRVLFDFTTYTPCVSP
jgi:hypothetical protein